MSSINIEKKCSHSFASQLIAWHKQYGRKDLPWQKHISPYRVWVSEIMLQQTQVSTVIPYFKRFIKHLPNINSLANANEDEVLHQWSGLGYYSRARNLHKTAKIITEEYRGKFPKDSLALQDLPGIGRSTAGAILASAFQIATPILDGNVKRVLARHEGIEGWPGKSAVASDLWLASEKYTPSNEPRIYTQAIMDLGATLCTRSKPLCTACPVNASCFALKNQQITELPGKKPKKALPVKQTNMYILVDDEGKVLLEKRPSVGIWGGLWSFPESERFIDQINTDIQQAWPIFRHTFSHFHLDITPVLLRGKLRNQIMDSDRLLWYNTDKPQALGLAAPVSKLLSQLNESTIEELLEGSSN